MQIVMSIKKVKLLIKSVLFHTTAYLSKKKSKKRKKIYTILKIFYFFKTPDKKWQLYFGDKIFQTVLL